LNSRPAEGHLSNHAHRRHRPRGFPASDARLRARSLRRPACFRNLPRGEILRGPQIGRSDDHAVDVASVGYASLPTSPRNRPRSLKHSNRIELRSNDSPFAPRPTEALQPSSFRLSRLQAFTTNTRRLARFVIGKTRLPAHQISIRSFHRLTSYETDSPTSRRPSTDPNCNWEVDQIRSREIYNPEVVIPYLYIISPECILFNLD